MEKWDQIIEKLFGNLPTTYQHILAILP